MSVRTLVIQKNRYVTYEKQVLKQNFLGFFSGQAGTISEALRVSLRASFLDKKIMRANATRVESRGFLELFSISMYMSGFYCVNIKFSYIEFILLLLGLC